MTTKDLLEASHLPVEFILVDVQDVFRKYMSRHIIDIIFVLTSNSREKIGRQ